MALKLPNAKHDLQAKAVPRASGGRGCHDTVRVSEPLSLRRGFCEFRVGDAAF